MTGDPERCHPVWVLALFLFAWPGSLCHAADEPFTYPTLWGGTGLMEIPTARVMRSDTWRIGASQAEPVRTYYTGFSPLAGLEVGGRVTEYLHTRSEFEQGAFQGYGNRKDKAVDLKWRFLPEGKYLPALALGIMDPHGTRLQAAQYLAASKQIYPFDFTVGFGNGRYGETPLTASGDDFRIEMFSDPKAWLEDGLLFYGIQFAPSERFTLMVEYSPIKQERFYRYVPDSQERIKSRYNVGVRWKPFTWAGLDLSWQRGTTLGLNCALAFDIGRPLIPIVDTPYRERPVLRAAPFVERLSARLAAQGFSDIGIESDEKDLWIEACNDRYLYSPRAVAEINRAVLALAPETVRQVHVTLIDNGIPRLQFAAQRYDLEEWSAERLTAEQLFAVSRWEDDVWRPRTPQGRYRNRFRYTLEPSFKTFLNDPSGFFKYRLGIKGAAICQTWRGGAAVLGLEGYPVNNISTANAPVPRPVRSDITRYEKARLAVGRLMFDQMGKTAHVMYGRIGVGWLEVEYAGLDAEAAMPLWDGRILVGVSGSAVKKRAPDTVLAIAHDAPEDLYTTAFFNARVNVPEGDCYVEVKAGRFLAGDPGTRVTVAKFIKGVVVAAWYGITDTAGFADDYNRGYRDKGIAVKIPIRLFQGRDSRVSYLYSLSPWTRDVAQDVDHYHTLFDDIGRDTRLGFRKDIRQMYQ